MIEEVPFCGCTNEELEEGRTCGQPQCPNADEATRRAQARAWRMPYDPDDDDTKVPERGYR